MTALRGVIFRCGIACLPLLAVVLLCVAMFSGLGRHKATPVLSLPNPLFPRAEASELETSKPQKIVKAAFERLEITHATIRVPD